MSKYEINKARRVLRTQRDPRWKDFFVQNPWAPIRLLREKFGVKDYDLANFRRKPEFTEIIGDKWNLTEDQSAERTRVIITAAFKYYLTRELAIDLAADTAVRSVLKLKAARPASFSFLWSTRLLRKLSGYDEWVSLGYTATSFLVTNLFPGPEWSQRSGILPVMFAQTSKTAINRNELIGLLEFVYIRHLQRLGNDASLDDVETAKRTFCIRYNERGFITAKTLREFGITPYLASHNLGALFASLARKFRVDIGIDADTSLRGWSAGEFRKKFPAVNTATCNYCGRAPIGVDPF